MPTYAAAIPRPPRTLTELEHATLLKVTGEHRDGFRDHVIFAVALGTGLREHEIAALDVGDVLHEDGRVKRRIALHTFKRSSTTSNGYLASVENPAGKRSYGYDSRGRRIGIVHEDGTGDFYVYERANVEAILHTTEAFTYRMTHKILYDGVDQPVRLIDKDGQVAYCELDVMGNVRRLRGQEERTLVGTDTRRSASRWRRARGSSSRCVGRGGCTRRWRVVCTTYERGSGVRSSGSFSVRTSSST